MHETQPDPSAENSLSAAARAADMLRERILHGDLPAGTALRETTLAAALSVSRNTLREALRQLLHEGLIEQALYRGATVRKMTHADVRDIFTARRTLQLQAIDLSAYSNEIAIARLDHWASIAEEAEKAKNWQEVGSASLHFHLSIVALMDSPLLDRFFQTVMAQLSLALEGRRAEAGFQMQWVQRNREICTLLRAGKRLEARKALQGFIDDSEKIVLDIVRANEQPPVAPLADPGHPGKRPRPPAP